MGRPRNRMENESRMKNRNMEAGGGGSAWGPPDRMGSLSQWQTWRDLWALRILQQPGAPPGHGRRRTGRRCYLYTVQSSGVFIVFGSGKFW